MYTRVSTFPILGRRKFEQHDLYCPEDSSCSQQSSICHLLSEQGLSLPFGLLGEQYLERTAQRELLRSGTEVLSSYNKCFPNFSDRRHRFRYHPRLSQGNWRELEAGMALGLNLRMTATKWGDVLAYPIQEIQRREAAGEVVGTGRGSRSSTVWEFEPPGVVANAQQSHCVVDRWMNSKTTQEGE
jgi:hypothetical protein